MSLTGKHPIPMRAYTVRELASFYGITTKCFRGWIAPFKEEIGQKRGNYYTVLQVQIMLSKLGLPDLSATEKSPSVPNESLLSDLCQTDPE